MSLSDLITGHDGKLSHAKLWPNIASAVATLMFIYQGYRNQLTFDTWLIYLGCVGGYSAVIQALAAWRGRPSKEAANDGSNQ
ncbi:MULTISPECIES: hypothetical protein [Burkholderia cepacia complex]|uniref:Uncharacterized protein n=2 Tax=Burkholderia cepacia complex TaxID=87882 RepID=A4JDH0_BURVG|nr:MULTISPECIES: hypothetical protein [Burkholderia cepacia complex]ABO54323.1 conserved hypothetical protein [Burkholderia vietnamiensis G4]KVE13204.1 hypothetical protein WI92_14740 [Burkholderia vietnamiensis]KVF35392.1 hypothetical protein WJ09_10465 [Burkholderia vietnamiensis]KVS12914.1 hypothetical protein WK32_32355 [Burkholderia vietnamiensis]KVS43804.1 hypothetical protein WK35_23610 [Burkholderia vietnamiensis]